MAIQDLDQSGTQTIQDLDQSGTQGSDDRAAQFFAHIRVFICSCWYASECCDVTCV